MCYSAIYDREWKRLHSHFEITKSDSIPASQRFFPRGKTGVLAFSKQEKALHLKEMTFGLKPHWAATDSYKSPPYNARMNGLDEKSQRLAKIFEKPTWRNYFGTHNCIVPVTSIFEICDREGGKESGNEVRFDSGDILFWAGIYSWHKSDSNFSLSFAGITAEPYPFVKSVGHSRSPKFLNKSQADVWLKGFSSQQEAYEFLEGASHPPALTYERVRELKAK